MPRGPRMTARTRAREVALQLLYWHDLNPRLDPAAAEEFVRGQLRERSQAPFALALYRGARAFLGQIDRALGAAAHNWRVARMAAVDRNVLRLGAYELLHTPETPAPVALDEAIELARRYGPAGPPAFLT